MKVTALKDGYFNGRIVRQGEQFEFNGEPAALGSWMGGEEAEKLRAKMSKAAPAAAKADDKAAAKAKADAEKEAAAIKEAAEKEAGEAIAAAKAEAEQIIADAQKAAEKAAKTAGENAGN